MAKMTMASAIITWILSTQYFSGVTCFYFYFWSFFLRSELQTGIHSRMIIIVAAAVAAANIIFVWNLIIIHAIFIYKQNLFSMLNMAYLCLVKRLQQNKFTSMIKYQVMSCAISSIVCYYNIADFSNANNWKVDAMRVVHTHIQNHRESTQYIFCIFSWMNEWKRNPYDNLWSFKLEQNYS